MNFNFNSPPPPFARPPPPPVNFSGFFWPPPFFPPPPGLPPPNIPPPTSQPPFGVRQSGFRPEGTQDDWIKKWEAKVKMKRTESTGRTSDSDTLKISTIKEKVTSIAVGIKELERLSKCLVVLKKSLSKEEWGERRKEIEEKKELLSRQLEEFSDPMIQSAKRALNKRLKKRARQKVKKEEWRCTKQEVALNREYEHRRIDMWLDKMKEEVERTRREESIKREADLVLSEVTRKKSEAKRTMNLLNTLGKLRNARVQTMENRGERVSQLETASFNQVIEKLKKYWVDQLNGYNLEEHGLRVMLNDAEVVRSDVELSLKKQILQEWDEALFGKRDGATDPEPQNLEQLVAIRYCWDNYLCEDNAILSSSIPLGWVVPTGPSNSDWASLLKK